MQTSRRPWTAASGVHPDALGRAAQPVHDARGASPGRAARDHGDPRRGPPARARLRATASSRRPRHAAPRRRRAPRAGRPRRRVPRRRGRRPPRPRRRSRASSAAPTRAAPAPRRARPARSASCSTTSTTERTRSRVWRRVIERVSSRGAVPKTSAVTGVWSPPSRSHAMNAAMPAWATSPTHERSSAESARYQSCVASTRRVAADESSPADRSTRCRVAVDVLTRADGIPAVYLYAAHNRPAGGPLTFGASSPRRNLRAAHDLATAPYGRQHEANHTVLSNRPVLAVVRPGTARSPSSRRASGRAPSPRRSTIAPLRTDAPLVIGHRGASGVPAGAHAGLLRAGRPDGRRLHRARPGLDQGPRAGGPPRERDLRHDRRRDQPEFAVAQGHQGHRRRVASPAGSPRTSPWPSSRRCGRRSGSRRCARRTPSSTAGSRCRRSRRCCGCASALARSWAARSASTRRRSTRPTSSRSGCRWRSRWWRWCAPATWTTAKAPIFIQSFELTNLVQLRERYRVDGAAGVPDLGVRRAVRPRVERRPAHLRGPDLPPACERSPPGSTASAPTRAWSSRARPTARSGTPTSLVADAHAAGLKVHPYTFRGREPVPAGRLPSGHEPDRLRQGHRRAGDLPADRDRRPVHRQRRHRRAGPQGLPRSRLTPLPRVVGHDVGRQATTWSRQECSGS